MQEYSREREARFLLTHLHPFLNSINTFTSRHQKLSMLASAVHLRLRGLGRPQNANTNTSRVLPLLRPQRHPSHPQSYHTAIAAAAAAARPSGVHRFPMPLPSPKRRLGPLATNSNLYLHRHIQTQVRMRALLCSAPSTSTAPRTPAARRHPRFTSISCVPVPFPPLIATLTFRKDSSTSTFASASALASRNRSRRSLSLSSTHTSTSNSRCRYRSTHTASSLHAHSKHRPIKSILIVNKLRTKAVVDAIDALLL